MNEKTKRILFWTILIWGVLFLTIFFLEVSLRLVFDFEPMIIKPDEQKLYVMYPNLNTTHDLASIDRYDIIIETNAYGYSSPRWFEEEKPAIVVIGDSFVGGGGVDYERFTYQLQNKLGSEVNVVAAGVSSYALDNEYLVMNELLMQYPNANIQKIYLVHFVNDDWDAYRNDIYAVKNNTLVDQTPVKLSKIKTSVMYLSHYSIIPQILWKVVTGSEGLMNFAAKVGISNQGDKYQYTIVHRGEIPSFMFSNDIEHEELRTNVYFKVSLYFEQFKQTAEERNIPFEVILIPLPEEIFASEEAKFKKQYGETLNPRAINDQIEIILNNKTITYIDLRSELKTANATVEYYFPYEADFHFSEQGHAFLAQLLFERLQNEELS